MSSWTAVFGRWKSEGRVDGAAALEVRLRNGDIEAVAEAYDAHHAAVRALARRIVGDEAVAEDLVQEVFVRLPSAAGRFDGRSSLRTFLLGIAVNEARHFVRAAARRRRAHDRSAAEPLVPIETPEAATVRVELRRRLLSALDALPIEQRLALVLVELEGHTSLEAAELLGVPEGTVRTRLFHARRKLREALGDEPRAEVER